MVQFKSNYQLRSYYNYYMRYLMISKYNFKDAKTLPHDVRCGILSDIAVTPATQAFLSWTTLCTLSGSIPLKSSYILNDKKTIKFNLKLRRFEALSFIVKLVHTVLILKEHLDVFLISTSTDTPSNLVAIHIDDIPISPELEVIAFTTEKRPFGALTVHLELKTNEDRPFVTETFWRMLQLPIERE